MIFLAILYIALAVMFIALSIMVKIGGRKVKGKIAYFTEHIMKKCS